MSSRPRAALLFLILAAGACERRAAREVPAAEHVPRTLPALPLQVNLPADVAVQSSGGSVVIVIHPGRRNPLRIDIKRAADGSTWTGSDMKKQALTPQLQLMYREQIKEGGSGGDEAIVDGELMLGSDRYRIRCAKQSEYAASATDCFPVLATLRSLNSRAP